MLQGVQAEVGERLRFRVRVNRDYAAFVVKFVRIMICLSLPALASVNSVSSVVSAFKPFSHRGHEFH